MRLRDVSNVEDSYESVRTSANFNGERSIFISIQRQPDANTVKVVDAVKAAMPGFSSKLPQSVNNALVNDRSISVRDALNDVTLTMLGRPVSLDVGSGPPSSRSNRAVIQPARLIRMAATSPT